MEEHQKLREPQDRKVVCIVAYVHSVTTMLSIGTTLEVKDCNSKYPIKLAQKQQIILQGNIELPGSVIPEYHFIYETVILVVIVEASLQFF